MTDTHRRGMGLALTVALATTAPAALAQDADDYAIEEIVVTSKLYGERNLQTIPSAITAYSGDMLQESGITDIRELAAIAPSLRSNQSQNSTTASFGVRGIGTSSQNFGLESSVGIYVDGVYRARQSSVINNLVDVDSIDVYRGPQGTLFGRNTPAGAVNLRTVNAGHERNSFFDVKVGDLGLVNIAAGGNMSIVEDKLAARLTAFYGRRDGFVDRLDGETNVLNDRNRRGGRLQFYWTPNDRFDMRVIADYSEIDEVCCAAVTQNNNFVGAGPTLGSDSILAAPPALGGLGVPVVSENQFDDNIVALNFLPRSTNKDSGLSVEFNYDWDTITLTSISAYRRFDTTDNIDADFSAAAILTDENLGEQRSFSQEFRLNGDIGDTGAWVAGAYYFTQTLDNFSTLTAGEQTEPFFALDPLLSQLVAGTNALAAFPVPGNPYQTAGVGFPNGAFATDDMRQRHDSVAVFGQLDFPLGDQFLITVGGRYTQEDKEMDGRFLNSPVGPTPNFTAIATTLGAINLGLLNPFDPANVPGVLATLTPMYSDTWGFFTQPALAPQPILQEVIDDSRTTGTVKLTWFANDDVMLYASYSTGYKSGGTNTDRIDPFFDQTFGAETSTSAEIGTKLTLADGRIRLNIAVHDTKFEDLQTNAFSGNGFNLQNAGDAQTRGVEFDFNWLPFDSTSILLNYAYNQGEFENFENGTCWVATPFLTGVQDPGQTAPNVPVCDRSGDRISSNPEHRAYFGLNQEFDGGGNNTPFIRLDYTYISDTMTDGNNDPLKLRDSFGFLHARIGVRFDNINSEIALWGRNLTDERFYETVFDVPVQSGKLNAYPHEPLTWGLSYSQRFD